MVVPFWAMFERVYLTDGDRLVEQSYRQGLLPLDAYREITEHTQTMSVSEIMDFFLLGLYQQAIKKPWDSTSYEELKKALWESENFDLLKIMEEKEDACSEDPTTAAGKRDFSSTAWHFIAVRYENKSENEHPAH